MNTGQILLTLGAFVLFSVTILNFNRSMNNVDSNLDYNRFRLEALSILTSQIEQASQYFFDEVSTDTTSDKNLADFTAPASLGWDSGDSNIVDDIDDLNGTTVADTGRSGVPYNVSYAVDYVTLNSGIITHSSSRQYHKRITVKVFDNYTPPLISTEVNGISVRDTLSMSFVVSYWFYN